MPTGKPAVATSGINPEDFLYNFLAFFARIVIFCVFLFKKFKNQEEE